DAGGDHWVTLNDRLDAGRGRGDMVLRVPASVLAGGGYGDLYSPFGPPKPADGGRGAGWGPAAATPPGGPPTRPGGASVSGVIFQDFNLGGTQDPGEPGLANVIVYLDANGNGQFDSGEAFAVTGPDGSYTISHLNGGSYALRVFDDTTGFNSAVTAVNVAP